ncbi:MAG: SGNH/GDSL hydrolase family protein [Vicinamibacterales bacterium]
MPTPPTRLPRVLAALMALVACGRTPVAPTPPAEVVAPPPTSTPPPTPPPAVVRTTRIMPLGDSTTQGDANHDSYRRPLWKALAAAGTRVDFVGSQSENHGGGPPTRDFDLDHEGHWGWRADEVLADIGGWAATSLPDVVLLHLGTNDVIGGQSTASTIDDLARIVARLRDANPAVTVVVAQILPTTTAAWNRGIEELNAQVPSMAARLTTAASPVAVVDQHTGFDARTLTYDGVHPNDAGESMMASRWLAALQRSGAAAVGGRRSPAPRALPFAASGVPTPAP